MKINIQNDVPDAFMYENKNDNCVSLTSKQELYTYNSKKCTCFMDIKSETDGAIYVVYMQKKMNKLSWIC